MEPDLDAFVGDLQARVIKDAREVYSEEVIRRWLDTSHAGVMKDPDTRARITGPCGDTMDVFLAIRDRRVARARRAARGRDMRVAVPDSDGRISSVFDWAGPLGKNQ